MLIITILAFSLKRNLTSIDKTMADIQSKIVGKDLCHERHEKLNADIQHNDRNIDLLFEKVNGRLPPYPIEKEKPF